MRDGPIFEVVFIFEAVFIFEEVFIFEKVFIFETVFIFEADPLCEHISFKDGLKIIILQQVHNSGTGGSSPARPRLGSCEDEAES